MRRMAGGETVGERLDPRRLGELVRLVQFLHHSLNILMRDPVALHKRPDDRISQDIRQERFAMRLGPIAHDAPTANKASSDRTRRTVFCSGYDEKIVDGANYIASIGTLFSDDSD
jgi:hypothetical protein